MTQATLVSACGATGSPTAAYALLCALLLGSGPVLLWPVEDAAHPMRSEREAARDAMRSGRNLVLSTSNG